MATHLRIHRDDITEPPAPDATTPEVLPFPKKALRERLVAGTVDKNPVQDMPALTAHEPSRGEWDGYPNVTIRFPGTSGIGRREDDITSTTDLVSRIEETLERMQERLNTFREQLDDTFKFPTSRDGRGRGDDPLPPAA